MYVDRLFVISGVDHWTRLLDWTTGLVQFWISYISTGLFYKFQSLTEWVDLGLDYWTGSQDWLKFLFLMFPQIQSICKFQPLTTYL